MAMTVGSGQVTATISGNIATGFPTGATLIIRDAAAVGTLYTVPAGKTLYIMSAWCSGSQNIGNNNTGQLSVQADDGTSLKKLVGITGGQQVAGAVYSAGLGLFGSTAFSLPIPVAATKTVTLATSGTALVLPQGGFVGYEV